MTQSLFKQVWQTREELLDICARNHRGNPESVAANAKVSKASQQKRILDTLKEWTFSDGLTCEELESVTGLSHQSCSARVSDLKRAGKIQKVGTRPTKSGCKAAVYKTL